MMNQTKNKYEKRDVVITGIGMITPLGLTTSQNWQAAIKGLSGLQPTPPRYHIGTKCPALGLVQGEQDLLSSLISAKEQKNSDRFVHLALIAGQEALADAGLLDCSDELREKIGIYCGVGIGGLETISEAVLHAQEQGFSRVSPFVIPRITANQAAGWLAKQYNLHGSCLGISTACSSGNDAIGLAYQAVAHGSSPLMLAGGSESCIIPLSLAGFENMRALSSWHGDPRAASRPFDRQRSGFVMAEGAGFVVLEDREHAQKRGARIYARCCGYGQAADGYHVAAIHPEGYGAQLAITRALCDARWNAEEVDYCNAHGTGTVMNDRIEGLVIQKLFSHADQSSTLKRTPLLVSSTKSMTGHMLGAAGAVEAGLTALSLYHSTVLPTITCDEQDSDLLFDCVPHEARTAPIKRTLSHSFGFGGGCAVLALSTLS